MKRILTLMTLLVISAALFAGIPHPVFVENTGDPASFEAYLGSDPGTLLTETSVGCGILDAYHLIMVECGNFPEWEFADVLYIVTDTQYSEVTLGYDNVQVLTGEEAVWYDGEPGDEVTTQNAFNTGWNLWSYNVDILNDSVAVVLAPLENLTKVKSITESYDPTLDDMFNTLFTLTDGYGYWVQVSADDSFELSGDLLPLSTPIALDSGWNLVGFIPEDNYGVEWAFDSLIVANQLVKVKSITESYDPTLDPMYNTLEMLYPGKGYWVNVNTDIMAFNYPEAERGRVAYEEEVTSYIWTPVVYTNSTCAYAMINETEGQIGAFVNGECRAVTEINDGYISLVINGEILETVNFKLFQNGQVSDLNTQIATAPGEDVFFDLTSEAPVVTNALSAYPNPFNPETTIAYDVATAGNVNVSVYNVKGQKIAELENGHKDAGQYNIVWKADSQASGIYFVRMNAAGTDQIQKVILMK